MAHEGDLVAGRARARRRSPGAAKDDRLSAGHRRGQRAGADARVEALQPGEPGRARRPAELPRPRERPRPAPAARSPVRPPRHDDQVPGLARRDAGDGRQQGAVRREGEGGRRLAPATAGSPPASRQTARSRAPSAHAAASARRARGEGEASAPSRPGRGGRRRRRARGALRPQRRPAGRPAPRRTRAACLDTSPGLATGADQVSSPSPRPDPAGHRGDEPSGPQANEPSVGRHALGDRAARRRPATGATRRAHAGRAFPPPGAGAQPPSQASAAAVGRGGEATARAPRPSACRPRRPGRCAGCRPAARDSPARAATVVAILMRSTPGGPGAPARRRRPCARPCRGGARRAAGRGRRRRWTAGTRAPPGGRRR